MKLDNIDNNRLALAFISLVIIASGCAHTGGGPSSDTTPTSSVEIQNFSAFPQNPYGNQQVRLQMEAKNLGDKDAQDVAAEIYNVPFVPNGGDNSDSFMFDQDTSRWVYESSIQAADPEADLPARSKRMRWSMTAPDLDPDLETPYNFRSNLYFKYNATATSSLTLMDQETYREEGPQGRPTVTNTAGPVKIEIRTRNPIVYEAGKSEMCVIVRNEGQGTTFDHAQAFESSSEKYNLSEGDDDYTGTVKLRVEDQAGVQFGDQQGEVTSQVDLIGNEGVQCYDIEVDSNAQSRMEVPFRVDAEYGYKKEASTSVTVTGSENY